VFYRVLRTVADDEVILDMAEFSLLTREVRDTIVQDVSSFPFIRASIGRVGFRRRGIPYRRGRRIAGQTHYNLWEMTKFAVAGILSSSTLFLRLPVYLLGPWLVAMAILAGLMVVRPSPWVVPVTIALGFAFCGASLSFLCMYMARTYKNTLGRPNAFVLEKFSLLQPPREATTAANSTPISAHR
jgi:dolichol-phosphate mannosyltransferase